MVKKGLKLLNSFKAVNGTIVDYILVGSYNRVVSYCFIRFEAGKKPRAVVRPRCTISEKDRRSMFEGFTGVSVVEGARALSVYLDQNSPLLFTEEEGEKKPAEPAPSES